MSEYYKDDKVTIYHGDCIDQMRSISEGSINCCVTSPPYFGLRDYGIDGQIGLEGTPKAFVAKMVDVFREVRRVLRDDGTCWLNLGDSYAGSGGAGTQFTKGGIAATGVEAPSTYKDAKHTPARKLDGLKPKDLMGIPWRVALALQDDGWYLRQDIIWHKPNPMPESVRDRCTKAHEYIFLLTKSNKYWYDSDAVREDCVATNKVGNATRNRRSVWSVNTKPYKGAHFATFPKKLVKPCVLAGCPVGGVVLDPFGGSGTTAVVAVENERRSVLCELNEEYINIAKERINAVECTADDAQGQFEL